MYRAGVWMAACGWLAVAVVAISVGDEARAARRKNAARTKPAAAAQQEAVPEAATNDIRSKLLGTWEDDYQGHRTLEVRDDGTATMTVEFSGWKARMFTRQLRMNLTWKLEDDRFVRETLGGEPAEKVDFVISKVGKLANDQILDVTADRMLLQDQDGSTRYTWRRVK